MRTVFLYSWLLLYSLISFGKTVDSTEIKKAELIINEAKKKYAPDRRSEYFVAKFDTSGSLNITVESTSQSAFEAIKTELNHQNIKATLNFEILPSKHLKDKIYGLANLSVCNNRFAADHTSEMATQVLLGNPVKLLKKENGYYLIRTPDNYISWTDDIGITALDSNQMNNWKLQKRIIYSAPYGQSYQEASKKSAPVSDLVAGNIFVLIAKEKQFYKVFYPDGRLAYIPLKEATDYSGWASQANPKASQIVKTAKSMIGIPYLWGGTSSKGLDCSGFTKTCYFLNGIILQRDASQQALYGESINILEKDTVSIAKCLQNLKPGDLLFFASAKNKRKDARITHTAIYLENGEFIQAAGLVKINSLISSAANYDKYQTSTLVSARRIISSINAPGITRVDQHPYYVLNR